MATPPRPGFLRLVHSDGSRSSVLSSVASGETQNSFLPSSQPNTVIFLDWSKAKMDDLLDIFELSRPKLILDMRMAPRFDLAPLTRKIFFDLLRTHHCQYIDVLGRIGVASIGDAFANPTLIAMHVRTFTEKLTPPHIGPLVFLHDDDAVDDDYVTTIAKGLPTQANGSWQVYRPLTGVRQKIERSPSEATDSRVVTPILRSVIFISHATPQDNAFVMWLASRLTTAGYEVWSDITNLRGGDEFWRNIEEVIRSRAAKVLFIHSTHIKGKSGARKEAYTALKTGEKNNLKRFVIPMRIDGTPFDETLIELIDLQSIDCRQDWLSGLKSLLALLERDRVPRSATFKTDQFADLVHKFDQPALRVIQVPEAAVSNLLPLAFPPQEINFFSCSGVQSHDMPSIAAKLNIPAFAHYTHIATTASLDRFTDEIASIGINTKVGERARVSWQEFLEAKSGDLPGWKRGDARNKARALLNKAWANYLESCGASVALMANNRPFWFFVDQHFPDNKVRFVDFSSRLVRRQLVGYSAKRRVFWHFGVQARPLELDGTFFFSITPHVTFSADGKEPLPSKSQLHSLRRSFCRSWWNDRWRDLMQGFIASLGADNNNLSIDMGAAAPMEVGIRFMEFSSRVSLQDATKSAEVALKPDDDVEDQWDDDFDDAELINDNEIVEE